SISTFLLRTINELLSFSFSSLGTYINSSRKVLPFGSTLPSGFQPGIIVL
ncbi:hypothetical protein D050_3658B, partial [Vibrio parahaemolyticus VPCR-2009]